jgi:GAF domain-containing protein
MTRTPSDELDLLHKITHIVSSPLQLQPILQLIVSMTATQSLSDRYRNKPPFSIHQSISGQAVLQKKIITVLDVRKDKRFSFPDVAAAEGLVSLLSVPMLFKDTVIGVLNTYTAEEHDFSRDDVSVLQSVANQCASAIVHTKLLTEKLAAQEALETRKQVDRAKNILMKKHGLSEPHAFREIQKQSMDRRKSMKEIAEAILLVDDLNT